MLSTTRLSCAFVVLAAASLSFASCNPNFEGHPVSILYADTAGLEELAVASDTAGANVITKAVNDLNPEFLVENSGHFPTSYLIKDQANHNLAVFAVQAPRAPPAPKLNTIDNTGKDERQYWLISCDTCNSGVPSGGVFGVGCQIANSYVSGFCVQQPGVLGQPPILRGCSGGSDQKFNFRREFP
ncbi:hypothetical protein DFH08DRAFT_943295 [Mycena albidolilacea]|uniref:Uncharacterized protein n=1 Tax=Mycena albidolilacea TaxID=1033008 RepID=A0AAD7ED61_9AGAR|nr:hypothetical protein DFH08DRAFT_943295 [Mycena albidolilacea]